MTSRYQQLRQAVARLAAPAEEQERYLAALFAGGTQRDNESAIDELALEFDDIFRAADHMIGEGELTYEQKHAIQAIDDLLARYSGMENADFWMREALFIDGRWSEIRSCATNILKILPDK